MSKANRKKVEAFIIKAIEEILPKGGNKAYYEERFAAMSDKAFDTFMHYLKDGGKLHITVPNMIGEGLVIERNLALLDKYKRKVFHHIEMSDGEGNRYVTPIPYMVVDLPIRRQEQHLTKKISVSEDNKHIDDLTGTRSSSSKGSRISFPQIQMLYSQGAEESIREFIKFRGGDEEAYRQMELMIAETGEVDMDAIPDTGEVRSIKTLRTFLKAMHLNNNL